MARTVPERSQAASETDSELPHLVTIVGRGVPANFEVTVDGELEMIDEDPETTATIVSKRAAEGSIDVGVTRFRFSGQMANVSLVDWNGVPAPDSSITPTVHVDYDVPNR
ncbi:hypothetical protein D8Y22_14310 [Salinadaptatus halalkaliphilus]|uniref:Uncharacterized protein n=1 Tax=Salinadaptatus halalkaliphilus TaxID=2419781 RepID=A0A4S3TJL3_9EURY|nr:hypothetical protein [Salinadaptatus halalkaliphilus]THE64231.1 hypothetical protein D8Y22_14310 [Salinadaptatus halalkaliphilus]